MLTRVVRLTLCGVICYYFMEYRDWLDLNKKYIYKVEPGPCRYVTEGGGSEDLTYIGEGIILISSGFELGVVSGKIKSLNLNTSEVISMTILNQPVRAEFLAAIHGITTWRDTISGTLYLYVLSHPTKEDTVEVFEMTSSTELTYIRTITDPLFTFMNDLVAVGKDKFYITKFLQSRDKFMGFAEMILRLKTGGVLYYDGRRARQMASDLEMPNGINISPDGKTVYVAEFNTKKLLGFSRDNTSDLQKSLEVYTDTMVDNIEVDPNTGDLYTGCYPLTYKNVDYLFKIFDFAYPSQVPRFKMRENMVSEIVEMYADDGSELQGSTVATYVNEKLIIGTVGDKTMVCGVNYNSK